VGELLFFRSQLDRVSLFDSLVSYCRFSLLFVHYFVLSQLNHFRLGDHIETSCSAHGRLVTPRCVAFVYRNPVALGSLGSVQQQSDLSFLLSHVLVFQLPAAACSRFPLLHGSYSCLFRACCLPDPQFHRGESADQTRPPGGDHWICLQIMQSSCHGPRTHQTSDFARIS